MTEVNNNAAATEDNAAATQREGLMQQLAGVQARLEKKGIGAAFYRAAKADPVGDTGFMGSLFLHALVGGPLEALIGSHLPVGHGELDTGLALGTMESLSILNENEQEQERPRRRPKCAFYPLGRNNKNVIIDKKQGKAAVKNSSRPSAGAQSELAFMFELMDALSKLEGQPPAKDSDKHVHLVTRKSADPAYQGVERRRRPRPEGLFNA